MHYLFFLYTQKAILVGEGEWYLTISLILSIFLIFINLVISFISTCLDGPYCHYGPESQFYILIILLIITGGILALRVVKQESENNQSNISQIKK